MRIPEKIFIEITANSKPVEGIPVRLTFVMDRKNHHGFIFGPSDATGSIEISADEVRRESRKEMELFLMDYVDIDCYWSGVLRAVPVNRESLDRATTAYRQFRNSGFPQGYKEMLERADVALRNLSKARLEATVRCEPAGKITIETTVVQVE